MPNELTKEQADQIRRKIGAARRLADGLEDLICKIENDMAVCRHLDHMRGIFFCERDHLEALSNTLDIASGAVGIAQEKEADDAV